jgi:hypothetical protein
MRIHVSKEIGFNQLHAAARYASKGGHGNVSLDNSALHGSRTHDHAHEIRLTGDGSVNRRRPNTGQYGADPSEYAASYDSWGWFFGFLYAIDPTMSCYNYADADDFHAKTAGVYRVTDPTGSPETPDKPRNASTLAVLRSNQVHA